MIPALVYMLCALTSTLCAIALLLKYRSSQIRLLFWSGICFIGLALNNIVLFIDAILIPSLDLSMVRTLPAVLGVALLLWGFIWDTV